MRQLLCSMTMDNSIRGFINLSPETITLSGDSSDEEVEDELNELDRRSPRSFSECLDDLEEADFAGFPSSPPAADFPPPPGPILTNGFKPSCSSNAVESIMFNHKLEVQFLGFSNLTVLKQLLKVTRVIEILNSKSQNDTTFSPASMLTTIPESSLISSKEKEMAKSILIAFSKPFQKKDQCKVSVESYVLRCPYCPFKTDLMLGLLEHSWSAHRNHLASQLGCGLCPFRHLSPLALWAHVSSDHFHLTCPSCTKCSIQFPNSICCQLHLDVFHSPVFVCPCCLSQVPVHLVPQHTSLKTCLRCSYSVDCRTKFLEHLASHLGRRRRCRRRRRRRRRSRPLHSVGALDRLRALFLARSRFPPYKTYLCDGKFCSRCKTGTSITVLQHSKTCGVTLRPTECTRCTCTKRELRSTPSVFANLLYLCSTCGDAFNTETAAVKHSAAHSPQFPIRLQCGFCRFTATSLRKLRQTCRTHLKRTTLCSKCYCFLRVKNKYCQRPVLSCSKCFFKTSSRKLFAIHLQRRIKRPCSLW